MRFLKKGTVYCDFLISEVILLGYVNTDVVNMSCPLYTEKTCLNFCKTFCLTRLICDTSQTAIDLIMVSYNHKISQSGVIAFGITDHFFIHCTRKVRERNLVNCHNTIRPRSLKNYDKEQFNKLLGHENWSDVMESEEVERAWTLFQGRFLSTVVKLAPLKRTEPG